MSSKRMRKLDESLNKYKYVDINSALDFIKKSGKTTKFEEKIDLSIRLKIDPKKSDQNMRGSFDLIHGIPKKLKIVVFTTPDKQEQAKKDGATIVGLDDLIEKIISDGTLEADICLCTKDVFVKVSKIAKIIGKLGLMPNQKDGTVTDNIKDTIANLVSGKRKNVRNDSAGHIKLSVGTVNFSNDQLIDNIKAVIKFLKENKPEKVKELFPSEVNISSTMGVGLFVPFVNFN